MAPKIVASIKRHMPVETSYDWGGGLVWIETPASADAGAADVRRAVATHTSVPSGENTARGSLLAENNRDARSASGSTGRAGSEPTTRTPCASSGNDTREQVQTRVLPMPRSRSSRGAPVCGNEPASRATSAATGSSGWKIRVVNARGVAAPSTAAPVAFAQITRLAPPAHSHAGIALIA